METTPTRTYDLEERTLQFAKQVRLFLKKLPHTIANIEDAKHLVRSSGAVRANYLEANEALGKKDFLMRLRIARKEAKESIYWLRLIDTGADAAVATTCTSLIQEATELMKILGAILRKSE
jgi:four helix bundle protein